MNWLQGFLRDRKWSVWLPTALGAALLLWALSVRVSLVDATLPYCQHLDENLWTERAIHILKTGDLNPHRFTKPSVMVYLTTAGLALGTIKAGMAGHHIANAEFWREGGYPYYTMPEAVRVPKLLVVLLSVVTMWIAAHLTRGIYRTWLTKEAKETTNEQASKVNIAWVGALTILLMALSPEYLRLSWLYINVDVIGCFFLMCTVSYIVLHPTTTSSTVVSLVTGVLVGLCLGTKYNLYPIFLPAFLMIAFYYRERWLASSVLLIGAACLTFLVTTPYALLDLPAFTWAAAKQAKHYATAAKAVRYDPGWDMFWQYAKASFSPFSPVVWVLALVGLLRGVWVDWRQTAILVVFPFVLWVYMSGQTVFFSRNLIVFQVYIPMYAALGAVWLVGRSRHWALARRPLWGRVQMRSVGLVVMGMVVLATSPLLAIANALDKHAESRVQVVDWLQREIPAGTVLLVAEELEMDMRPLKKRYKVKEYRAVKKELKRLHRRYPGAVALVPEFKGRSRGRVHTTPGKVLLRLGRSWVRPRPHKVGSSRVRNSEGNPKLTVVRLDSRVGGPP